MDDQQLLTDLRMLKSMVRSSDVVSMNERIRTYQNVGGFILRSGRLGAIIEALEKKHAERA